MASRGSALEPAKHGRTLDRGGELERRATVLQHSGEVRLRLGCSCKHSAARRAFRRRRRRHDGRADHVRAAAGRSRTRARQLQRGRDRYAVGCSDHRGRTRHARCSEDDGRADAARHRGHRVRVEGPTRRAPGRHVPHVVPQRRQRHAQDLDLPQARPPPARLAGGARPGRDQGCGRRGRSHRGGCCRPCDWPHRWRVFRGRRRGRRVAAGAEPTRSGVLRQWVSLRSRRGPGRAGARGRRASLATRPRGAAPSARSPRSPATGGASGRTG